MGCASSQDAPSTVSLEAAQRINDAIVDADRAFDEGRTAEAVAIVTAARDENVPLLIGSDLPAYSVRATQRLADYKFAAKEFRAALPLYADASRIALRRVQTVREGSYLMVLRYTEASVGAARCHLGLLEEAHVQLAEASNSGDGPSARRRRRAQSVAAAFGSPRNAPEGCSLRDKADDAESPQAAALDMVGPSDSNPLATVQPSVTPAVADDSTGAAGQDALAGRSGATDAFEDEDGYGLSVSSAGSGWSVASMALGSKVGVGADEQAREWERVLHKRVKVIERRLLECAMNIDRWHSHRSEMLIAPLSLLAELYERLEMWRECERVVRRLSGVYLVKYGHAHPAYVRSHQWLNRLVDLSEARAAEHAATRIVATWKMRRAVVALATRLGRDPRGHDASLSSSASTPEPEEQAAASTTKLSASFGVGRGSPRNAASGADVVALAADAEDAADGDDAIRRQLEQAPRSAATSAAWITPADDEAPVVAAETSPRRAEPAVASRVDDEPPLSLVAIPVTRASDRGDAMQASAKGSLRRSLRRGQSKSRVLTSLVFAGADAAGNGRQAASLWQVS